RRLPSDLQRVDERLCQLKLLFGHLDVLYPAHERPAVTYLVGEEQGFEPKHTAGGTDRNEVGLGYQDEPPDADPTSILHRSQQHRIRLLGVALGHHDVALLEEPRIDIVELDEVLDVDRAARRGAHRFDLVAVEHHHSLIGLVATAQIVVPDLPLFGG